MKFASPQRRILIVAFHYPPVQGSTGVHRTLAFSKYLRDHGWEVKILTAVPSAYPDVRDSNLNLIPPHVSVERGWGVDIQKASPLGGRYPTFLAVPDRWQSWIAGGVVRGLRIFRKWRPQVIMSTYPLASAHAIGYALSRLTGTPWVADFRDPMLQPNYPTGLLMRRSFGFLERRVFSKAARVVVTTDGAAELYRDRYPDYGTTRISVVPNGFDEELLTGGGEREKDEVRPLDRKMRILHVGLLYEHERNPEYFFRALSQARETGRICEADVEFCFVGSGFDQQYAARVRDLGLERLVTFQGTVPYQLATQLMQRADAFLLFQGMTCDQQIPAKVYEYLAANKPIMALTTPAGDTGRLLLALGCEDVVPMESEQSIREHLPGFLKRVRDGTIVTPTRDMVLQFSRRKGTEELAKVLESAQSGH